MMRHKRWKTPSQISVGAAKFVHTFWMTRGLKTYVPVLKVQTRGAVLDGDLDKFIEASLKQGL